MDLFQLASGELVPREVVHLAIDLELRGFTFRAEGDSLTLTNTSETGRDTLTEEDRNLIRKWKKQLLVVVSNVY